MPSSSIQLSEKVISHLEQTYNIDKSNAGLIYNDARNLYHQLFTMVDLNPLQTTDNRILSSLVIIITERFDFSESSGYEKRKIKLKSLFFRRLLLSIIMYIITFCQRKRFTMRRK
jgi:hypothetical protein